LQKSKGDEDETPPEEEEIFNQKLTEIFSPHSIDIDEIEHNIPSPTKIHDTAVKEKPNQFDIQKIFESANAVKKPPV
jgi:hypothetical protein